MKHGILVCCKTFRDKDTKKCTHCYNKYHRKCLHEEYDALQFVGPCHK